MVNFLNVIVGLVCIACGCFLFSTKPVGKAATVGKWLLAGGVLGAGCTMIAIGYIL